MGKFLTSRGAITFQRMDSAPWGRLIVERHLVRTNLGKLAGLLNNAASFGES